MSGGSTRKEPDLGAWAVKSAGQNLESPIPLNSATPLSGVEGSGFRVALQGFKDYSDSLVQVCFLAVRKPVGLAVLPES